jgi:hypothetical protein
MEKRPPISSKLTSKESQRANYYRGVCDCYEDAIQFVFYQALSARYEREVKWELNKKKEMIKILNKEADEVEAFLQEKGLLEEFKKARDKKRAPEPEIGPDPDDPAPDESDSDDDAPGPRRFARTIITPRETKPTTTQKDKETSLKGKDVRRSRQATDANEPGHGAADRDDSYHESTEDYTGSEYDSDDSKQFSPPVYFNGAMKLLDDPADEDYVDNQDSLSDSGEISRPATRSQRCNQTVAGDVEDSNNGIKPVTRGGQPDYITNEAIGAADDSEESDDDIKPPTRRWRSNYNANNTVAAADDPEDSDEDVKPLTRRRQRAHATKNAVPAAGESDNGESREEETVPAADDSEDESAKTIAVKKASSTADVIDVSDNSSDNDYIEEDVDTPEDSDDFKEEVKRPLKRKYSDDNDSFTSEKRTSGPRDAAFTSTMLRGQTLIPVELYRYERKTGIAKKLDEYELVSTEAWSTARIAAQVIEYGVQNQVLAQGKQYEGSIMLFQEDKWIVAKASMLRKHVRKYRYEAGTGENGTDERRLKCLVFVAHRNLDKDAIADGVVFE